MGWLVIRSNFTKDDIKRVELENQPQAFCSGSGKARRWKGEHWFWGREGLGSCKVTIGAESMNYYQLFLIKQNNNRKRFMAAIKRTCWNLAPGSVSLNCSSNRNKRLSFPRVTWCASISNFQRENKYCSTQIHGFWSEMPTDCCPNCMWTHRKVTCPFWSTLVAEVELASGLVEKFWFLVATTHQPWVQTSKNKVFTKWSALVLFI